MKFPELAGVDAREGFALVVGLGNPGRRYRDSRHNAGSMAADRLLWESEVISSGEWPEGKLALVKRGPLEFLVLKPSTYMNVSGSAVAPVMRHYGITLDRLVVLHDDIDIPLGDVREKLGGGTGGHRGLDSLKEHIQEGGFWRVRIGVGRPPEGVDPADYVLESLSDTELGQIERSADRAAEVALEMMAGMGT